MTGNDTILVRDGTRYTEAHEHDGIKLIYPTGTESCGRVRNGISPTIMTGPVVGVVVRRPIESRIISAHNMSKNTELAQGQIDDRIVVLATFGWGRLHNQCILGTDGICPCIVQPMHKDPLKIGIR